MPFRNRRSLEITVSLNITVEILSAEFGEFLFRFIEKIPVALIMFVYSEGLLVEPVGLVVVVGLEGGIRGLLLVLLVVSVAVIHSF